MDLTFYDVKPIPKYILGKIKRKDLQLHRAQDGHTRFYAYLVKWKDELVKITVAVKCKYSQWYCKQVAVHSVHGDNCLVKDMEFHYIAGHKVGWYEEGLYYDKKWYEGCGWGWSDNPKAFDPYAPIVNMCLLKKFPQYKYSMANGYGYVDIIQYLALYEKYPHMELIVKLGLRWYACSVQLDQYKTQKTLMEEKERQKLAHEFAVVVDKYMPLQLIQGDGFVCIIAKSQDDLVNEGKALHHCVGSMNYNKRMIREESLIFFVRKADDVDTPLVTIEYSLEKKKVLQCYGSHNSTPNEDIMKYVNKTWLPYANKNLKRLQAAA